LFFVSEASMVLQGPQTVVIGGGPAGLAAAYEAARKGCAPIVVERGALLGGIARTEEHKGFRFDIGGHRFFTKVQEVFRLWKEILREDFLERERLSRIHFRGRFLEYPLRPADTLRKLGFVESVRVVGSFVHSQLFPHPDEGTFEAWVSNRFGRRLFEIFFEEYTEKVWGCPCREISAEWARQRIRSLTLGEVLKNAFPSREKTVHASLIDRFHYPRLGPGMLWDGLGELVAVRGGLVERGSEVVSVLVEGPRVRAVKVAAAGTVSEIPVRYLISSAPLDELIEMIEPAPPSEVLRAARSLKYRDFVTVGLVVRRRNLFPDNWIYVHTPGLGVGRIQNYGNWSPEMVPDSDCSSLGLEYFCSVHDEIWNMDDEALLDMAARELSALGIAERAEVIEGVVFRQPKAYPMYVGDHGRVVAIIRSYLDRYTNLSTIGRNGLHRYNNMDHSMLTGLYAARKALGGRTGDIWAVNVEEEYLESTPGSRRHRPGGEAVEARVRMARRHATLARNFARLDELAFGIALGVVSSVALAAATAALVVKGGMDVGRNLSLLGQYLPGFRVSPAGAFLGGAYGFAIGLGAGWLFAKMRNVVLFAWLRWISFWITASRGFFR